VTEDIQTNSSEAEFLTIRGKIAENEQAAKDDTTAQVQEQSDASEARDDVLSASVVAIERRIKPLLDRLKEVEDAVLQQEDRLYSMEYTLDHITDGGELTIFREGNLWRVVSDFMSKSELAFSRYMSDPSTLEIGAGTICIGDTNIEVSADSVSLSGSTEWVYIDHTRGTSSASIAHAAARPTSNTTHLFITLSKYQSDVAGIWYQSEIHHIGDVVIDSPLQS